MQLDRLWLSRDTMRPHSGIFCSEHIFQALCVLSAAGKAFEATQSSQLLLRESRILIADQRMHFEYTYIVSDNDAGFYLDDIRKTDG